MTNPVTLLSVNGPQFTVIDAGGTTGCVSLTNGASLSGFTLTHGNANTCGCFGGAYGGTLYNLNTA